MSALLPKKKLVSEVRCPACGFETAPTFQACPRCHRPMGTVMAPRSANVGKSGQGVVWPVALVGLLVVAGIVVLLVLLDKNDPGDTRAYVSMETVFDRRIEQIVSDPKPDAQTKEWARRIKTDCEAGTLDRMEGLVALKNVATNETREQRIGRLRDQLCAQFTVMIDEPMWPEEFKDMLRDARRNAFDMGDDEFEKAHSEMESLMDRYDY